MLSTTGVNTVTVPGLGVTANTSNHSKSVFSLITCYSIIQFNTNGNEDANSSASSSSPTSANRGVWLDGGSSSDVWVQRVITSGTLNHADPGSGRLNLGTSRLFGLSRGTNGISTVNVDFNFYDAAAGGNLLDTVSISMIATVDSA